MDLDEWEVLSDDGFIDQDGGRNISPKEKHSISNIVDMNYFHKLIEPPLESQKDSIPIPNTNQISVVPVSISEEDPQEEVVKEVIADEDQVPVFPTSPSSETEKQMISSVPKVEEALDMETITHQVFFNKAKETNQFVDLKLDSPKSVNMGILPLIDVGVHQFEEKVGDLEVDEKTTVEMSEEEKEGGVCWEGEVDHDDHQRTDKSNLWKFGLTGIGALFSFGFACATTVCIIAFGSHHREKQHRQRVHFHVFADDKSINQVVHHANKLNEAISGLRSGAPVNRAQITIGGYFEGL